MYGVVFEAAVKIGEDTKMFGKPYVIVALILVIACLGCKLLSSEPSTEVVFEPTAVGMPAGTAIKKTVGPEGGILASPDGRLTITIPPNALVETAEFAIQPITNKAVAGLGSAYRLEPAGKTFAVPLGISVKYNDNDLEGTVPEALSLAYQDEKGAWHVQKFAKLDKANETVSVSATHFSDWSLAHSLQISPAKAKVHTGESVDILVTQCAGLVGILDKLMGIKKGVCTTGWWTGSKWKLMGEGKLTEAWPRMIYTAPGKKPTPNVVTVVFTDPGSEREVEVPCRSQGATDCHSYVRDPKSVESVITILDMGYKATGQTPNGLVFSGVICSLDKPFTVFGKSMLDYTFKFTPSSESAGNVDISASGMGVTGKGGGTYAIEGIDSDKPRIAVTGSVTGTIPLGSRTGSGTIYIDLIPLDTSECGGESK